MGGGGRELPYRFIVSMVALAMGPSWVAGQHNTGSIVGVVISLPSRQPLSGALIQVAGGGHRAISDSAGNFLLGGLPDGNILLEGRALGYSVLAESVSVVANAIKRVNFAFHPLVITLPSVSVNDAADVAREARLRGFHQRRQAGFGRFLTRQDIDKRDARESKDLLRGVPGVRVTGNRIQMTTGTSRGCVVQYFVDGLHIVQSSSEVLMGFRPRDIEGIEIYRGPAETPPEFSRGGAECGVIALWTRMGGRP
jgi:hypothetical protein